MRHFRSPCFLSLIHLLNASPVALPQAITQTIAPSASMPPSCTANVAGTFAIVPMNVTTTSDIYKRQASSQPTAMIANPISEIGDGQPQAASSQSIETMTPETMVPVVQIGDGQIQHPQTAATPATATLEPTSLPASNSNSLTASPKTISFSSTSATPTASPRALAHSSTNETASSSDDVAFVACQRQGTLNVTLTNGVLTDSRGATGYIASNYQFQFDNPPQAGAIYTAGFSMCGNGSLALGESAIFYACRSGNFSNLYDRWIAPQCYPVYIRSVSLITC